MLKKLKSFKIMVYRDYEKLVREKHELETKLVRWKNA